MYFFAQFQDYLIDRNRKIVLHFFYFFYKADGVHEKNKERN